MGEILKACQGATEGACNSRPRPLLALGHISDKSNLIGAPYRPGLNDIGCVSVTFRLLRVNLRGRNAVVLLICREGASYSEFSKPLRSGHLLAAFPPPF